MNEVFEGSVLFSISPDELDEHNLTEEIRNLAAAEARHVIVCRKGGTPSWTERIWAFIRRKPIEAETVIANVREEGLVEEGNLIRVPVYETDYPGVWWAEEDIE